MNYIVLDLEWNQPFTLKHMKRRSFLLTGEIIQIGAVKLDEHFTILDTFKIGVCPKYYTILQKHVSKVVNLNQNDIYLGFSFPVAFNYFIKWCKTDFVFLTWGHDDIPMLKDNMRLHNIKQDSIPIGYNVQLIFINQTDNEHRQYSLVDALTYFNIEQNRTVHDALNDAYYTAKICGCLDISKGIAEHIELEHINTNQKQSFINKEDALTDDKVNEICCPICGTSMTYERWIRQNGNKMIALASCVEHGDFFARIKLIRQNDNTIRVSKMIYKATEEMYDYYNEKYLECKARELLSKEYQENHKDVMGNNLIRAIN